MKSEMRERCSEAVLIGRALLATASPRLEAFLGNALYCGRGMPTMNKYKTVKEVCALTGLTRKHLYYFHHEKVVQAAAYANYSVEGNDGYKLYDDEAVEKLQQIAMYYQLGLKRNEIRDIMRDPHYDGNAVVESLLESAREEKQQLERRIAALEYLALMGVKNGAITLLQGHSLEELGCLLPQLRQSCDAEETVAFFEKFAALLSELGKLDETKLNSAEGEALIGKLFTLGADDVDTASYPCVLGVLASVLGEGTAAREVRETLTPTHVKAVIRYIKAHPDRFAFENFEQL